ncbi:MULTISPECIES: hypothetical protein [Desulfofundulus]|uniref:CNNM transmembrane domain-containing protein n=1 Tax=Desulfofundulus australicus DSM 11792 TaxID=1121425 RepID=A0A1M5AG72_9FIRM|nr:MULTISPECIES: hypothetical protein [Desulfofundulus]MBE3584682.1 hypothetical protein [Thermoanaerobacter sp.]MCS5694777.1 hypothetical protein [Desulfofundulus thermocisternus]SHF29290.1 hypothetical protein SAMN02745218_01896 [Desulfofundulus australicus DSM 11792]
MGNNKSTVSGRYVLGVSTASFLLAILFFWLSELLSGKVKSLFLSFLFLVIIILIGIIADIVGTAVAAAEESPFHARAAKRVRGAREGVYLIRNADRVANICNDVIGDIAGTVSGALGIALVLQILLYWKGINQILLNMLVTAFIAAFTVGGKAAGKRIAISRANDVIFLAGKVLAAFEQLTKISLTGKKGRATRK